MIQDTTSGLEQYLQPLVDKLQGWLEALVAGLPNFVIAVGVVVTFGLAARVVNRVTHRGLARVSESEVIARLMGRIIRYVVIVVGLFIALGILGLDKTVTSLLAGAGVVGLAIGLAFQDLAANFLAGVIMGVRRPFEIDQVVETNGYMGKVRKLNLRNTIIETFSGQQVLIPNKHVFENPLVNYHHYGRRRIDIEVGVTYGSDLDRVTKIARTAIEALPFRAPETDVNVHALAFGDSSINFTVRYWIEYPGDHDYFDAIHDGVVAIKAAFDEHDITIPFPIRTLDFESDHDRPLLVRTVQDADGSP